MQGQPRRYNPKRAIRSAADPAWLARITIQVVYTGSPYHKLNPGDFNFIPPVQPRPDASLCDQSGIFTRAEALELLREGVRRGLVSVQQREDFPQNIWAVTPEGYSLEAQLENQVQGSYHGYPLEPEDELWSDVLKALGEIVNPRFDIDFSWLASDLPDERERATLAEITIDVGGLCATEVEDIPALVVHFCSAPLAQYPIALDSDSRSIGTAGSTAAGSCSSPNRSTKRSRERPTNCCTTAGWPTPRHRARKSPASGGKDPGTWTAGNSPQTPNDSR